MRCRGRVRRRCRLERGRVASTKRRQSPSPAQKALAMPLHSTSSVARRRMHWAWFDHLGVLHWVCMQR